MCCYNLVFHISTTTASQDTNFYGYDDGFTRCSYSVVNMADSHNAVSIVTMNTSLAVIVLIGRKLGLSVTTLGTN